MRALALRNFSHSIRRSLINGTIIVVILQRANREPIYGGALAKAMRQFGYSMSPGTLYPLLHTLEQEKLLRSWTTTVQGRVRRYYEITPSGRECYKEARELLTALMQELLCVQDTPRQPKGSR